MKRPLFYANLSAVAVLLACSSTAPYTHPAEVSLSCQASAPPIESEADAICHGRHWAALESRLVSYQPHYTAELNEGTWSVSMGPPNAKPEIRWEIDAKSGELIRVLRQPMSP
jgi:hypothetical protein